MDNLETIAVVSVSDNSIKQNTTIIDLGMIICFFAPIIGSYLLYKVMKFGSNILNRLEARRIPDNYQI